MDVLTNNQQQQDSVHELAETYVHIREEHEHDMQLTKFHITPLSTEEIVLLIAEAKGFIGEIENLRGRHPAQFAKCCEAVGELVEAVQ